MLFSNVGRYGNFAIAEASLYGALITGAFVPTFRNWLSWMSGVSMNFTKSYAVALCLPYTLIAALCPPSVDVPSPLMPGSGATPNLSFTFEFASPVRCAYTYGQFRKNNNLPPWNASRLGSSV